MAPSLIQGSLCLGPSHPYPAQEPGLPCQGKQMESRG